MLKLILEDVEAEKYVDVLEQINAADMLPGDHQVHYNRNTHNNGRAEFRMGQLATVYVMSL